MTVAPQDRMHEAIGMWMKNLDNVDGWKQWNRGKVRYVMFEASGDETERQREFFFPEPIASQHSAIMSYLELYTSLQSLSDLQYYFRRYPFRGLPISRSAHFRYMCELYFSKFYEFRERIKICLNAVNGSIAGSKLQVGQLIKAFDREFDQELRERHGVHHRGRFEERGIDRLMWSELISFNRPSDLGWATESKQIYRTMAKEWSKRVGRRAKQVSSYLDAIADAMLTSCDYLNFEDS